MSKLTFRDGFKNRRSPEYLIIHGLPPDAANETHEDWVNRIHPGDATHGQTFSMRSPAATRLFRHLPHRAAERRPDALDRRRRQDRTRQQGTRAATGRRRISTPPTTCWHRRSCAKARSVSALSQTARRCRCGSPSSTARAPLPTRPMSIFSDCRSRRPLRSSHTRSCIRTTCPGIL